jgi:uncharacterized spore protein YtfJ
MNLHELLEKMGTNLSVGRAFGTAYEKEGTLLIPVAIVAGGGGGGEGTGPMSNLVDDARGTNEACSPDRSGGSGSGFGGFVLPIGAYVVTDDSVRWVPAVNANVVIFAGVAVLRLLLNSRRRSYRRRHWLLKNWVHVAMTVRGALFAALTPIFKVRDGFQVASQSEVIVTSQFGPTLVESR